MDDHELLREYTEQRSERAFTSLVERHLPLVYGTALRMLREQPAAQDVAQTVFIQLANNAVKVRNGYTLPGWLYRATQRAAFHALRDDHRRRQRETTAMNLAEQNNDSSVAWEKLSPLLDEALSRLNRVEQDAVLLRYFDGRSLNETGRALSLSEAAAQKRVGRALEKMRRHFVQRGVSLSAILLGATLDSNAKAAVPDGLALSVSANALSKTTVVAGLTSPTFFTMITSKRILGFAAAIVAIGLATISIIQHQIPVSSSVASRTTNTPSQLAPRVQDLVSATPPKKTTKVPVVAEQISAASVVQVMGCVNQPGLVTISADEAATIGSVIVAAGGLWPEASRLAVVTRKLPDGTTTQFKNIDVNAAGGSGQDFALQDGDSIYLPMASASSLAGASSQDVPPVEPSVLAVTSENSPAPMGASTVAEPTSAASSFRSVLVDGEVIKPGLITASQREEITIVSVIAAVGGPTENASQFATITRTLPGGKTTVLTVDLKAAIKDSSQDLLLIDGDKVFLDVNTSGIPQW